MSEPKVTTLLSPNPASGTWAPTDNTTETTLASSTNAPGSYQLRMDTNNQAGGDLIQISYYTYAGGTTERLVVQYTLGPLAPLEKIHIGPAISTSDDYKVTAKLLAGSGTSRSFPWDVQNLYGT